MAFFRQKGKYWYFVETSKGKEVQHYLGDEGRILRLLAFANKLKHKWSSKKWLKRTA